MIRPGYILRIDQRNEILWQKRFSELLENEIISNLTAAQKEHYQNGISYSQLNLAANYFYNSKNGPAMRYLLIALRWFREHKNEKGYVRAILLKGNILESLGDYENALKLWMEALNISRLNNDKENEGESCSQLGLIYSRLCNFSKSLDFLRMGMKIREELGDENGVASSLNRIGMVLRQNHRYEESLENYFKSLEIRRRNNQASISWSCLGIANTYEELKNYGEALKYYNLGITGADSRCRLHCLLGSGRIFSSLTESAEAEKRLKEALRLGRELKSKVLVAEIHSAMADHYERCGKPVRALSYLRRFLKLKESLQSSEMMSRLSNIEVEHAVERSEFEKEVYRLKHVEMKKAYDIIEENNKYITASINYASRIQKAILPDLGGPDDISSKMFVLYKPKEIISGDFYWLGRVNNKLAVVAADCTGHGIPGALMSMVGVAFLENIIISRGTENTSLILGKLRSEIRKALHQDGYAGNARDGMDMSVCIIDESKAILQFSGAYNNLILISKGRLSEYEADKMPVGISDMPDLDFRTYQVPFRKGDMIYMFSDGYADQLGGPDHKRFKSTRLKDLLISIHKLSLRKQKEKLEKEFSNWKGGNEQTDDVMIIGLRL